MTAWVTIDSPCAVCGDVPVQGFPTAVPGLLIQRPGALTCGHGNDEDWAILHHRSGLVVGFTGDPEGAQVIAVRLGKLADWTVPGEQLTHLRDDVRRLVAGSGSPRGEHRVRALSR